MAEIRSPYWDTLKGVLILLVIFGHCGTALSTGLISLIYAFHMPLFVLISGYFAKKQSVISKSNKRLIIIYLLFNTVYLLPELATDAFSINRLLIPSFALWYILSLIFWRFILQLLPSIWLNKPICIMAGSVVIALIAGFIPMGTELSFQRTLTFWSFFIMGFYIRKFNCINNFRRLNKWLSSAVLVTLLIVVYLWLPPFYGNNCYGNISDLYMRGLQLILAAVICICILIIMPENLGQITQIGRFTLLLYLLHPPLVKLMKMMSVKIGYDPDIIVAMVITIVTGSLIFMVRKFKIFKYLT